MIGTRLEIDLEAIEHNLTGLRRSLPPGTQVAGVVKANAYGHGLIQVSKKLADIGIDYLATANIREAIAIRQSGIDIPILVMGRTFEVDFGRAVEQDITLTIASLEEAQKLNLNASIDNRKVRVHIKLDTGFNRLGYKDFDVAFSDILAMQHLEYLDIEGIFTHLALTDVASDAKQFEKFEAFLKRLSEADIVIPIRHACDSIGAVAYPDKAYDMVRVGALLYGYCSRKTDFELKPAMTLKTNVAAIRKLSAGEGVSYDHTFVAEEPAVLATLPIGYADGIPRSLSNRGTVEIGGGLARFVGLMCMDQSMIDVTGLGDVKPGDEVVLFGRTIQMLSDIASIAGTNRNEILARMAHRVLRVYYDDGQRIEIWDGLSEGHL
ncbi:MAG: alanine racemase [Clostridiales bacterium]|nr:alanine racemase [Clostridiales bacterium]